MVAEKEGMRKRIENVLELLREWECVTDGDQAGRLKEFGYDYGELAATGVSFVGELLDDSLREEREMTRHARLVAEEEAKSYPSEDKLLTDAQVDAALQEIVASNFGKAYQQRIGVHMRNFREATRDDKMRLLRDLRVLKKLIEHRQKDETS